MKAMNIIEELDSSKPDSGIATVADFRSVLNRRSGAWTENDARAAGDLLDKLEAVDFSVLDARDRSVLFSVTGYDRLARVMKHYAEIDGELDSTAEYSVTFSSAGKRNRILFKTVTAGGFLRDTRLSAVIRECGIG